MRGSAGPTVSHARSPPHTLLSSRLVSLFATPSIYMDVAKQGPTSRWLPTLLAANPVSGLISGFRAAALDLPMPWQELGVGVAASLLAFAAGCLYFRKVENSFADVI